MPCRSIGWLSLLCLCIAGCLGNESSAGRDSNEPPAILAATSHQDALDQARRTDVPLLQSADMIAIEEAKAPLGAGRRVVVKRGGEVKGLVRLIQPSPTPIVEGKVVAILTFYRNDKILRQIWIHPSGEWGFDRPGTRWSIGSDPHLWELVKKHLGQG